VIQVVRSMLYQTSRGRKPMKLRGIESTGQQLRNQMGDFGARPDKRRLFPNQRERKTLGEQFWLRRSFSFNSIASQLHPGTPFPEILFGDFKKGLGNPCLNATRAHNGCVRYMALFHAANDLRDLVVTLNVQRIFRHPWSWGMTLPSNDRSEVL